MIVRYFWRDCTFIGKNWVTAPVDAFWVEATYQEARTAIFPRLQPAAIEESKKLAEQYKNLAKHIRRPSRPFCFLVTRDLSAIDPFAVHYPFHPMWNAYSPFEAMTETVITDLDALKDLQLPVQSPSEE